MCEKCVGDRTSCNILTPNSSFFSSTSFSFCWAAQSGILRAHSPLLGTGFLYNILSPTNRLQTNSTVCRAGVYHCLTSTCFLWASHLHRIPPAQSWRKQVLTSRSKLARPSVMIHWRKSLILLPLLFQQGPTCLVCLTWIVFFREVWKSDFTDKIKRSFFQVVVVWILLYGCTTWTLTKRMGENLDSNYKRMLQAIMKKSWGGSTQQSSSCAAT